GPITAQAARGAGRRAAATAPLQSQVDGICGWPLRAGHSRAGFLWPSFAAGGQGAFGSLGGGGSLPAAVVVCRRRDCTTGPTLSTDPGRLRAQNIWRVSDHDSVQLPGTNADL